MNGGQNSLTNSSKYAVFDPKYQPEDTFWFHLRLLTMQDLLNKLGTTHFDPSKQQADQET